MNGPVSKLARCAIYTRKSTEYNLELAFNSLDAQREACEAYIKSQAHEGWRLIPGRYDDGAFSGASLDRPALQQLLADVRAGKIDIVLVYKVDRLTRSLADFAKLIELFDAHGVSFVSVTQSFNTSSSMGRLDGLRLTECDDSGISRHGVSLLSGEFGRLDPRLDTPPSINRRHPDSGLAHLLVRLTVAIGLDRGLGLPFRIGDELGRIFAAQQLFRHAALLLNHERR